MTGQMDHASNPKARRKAREGERRMHADRQRADRAAPADSDRETLAGRIRFAREYIGFTVAQAAVRLGLGTARIDAIEAGTVPDDGELVRLGALYRRPPEWFRGATTLNLSDSFRQMVESPRLTGGDREALLDFAEFLQSAGPAPRVKQPRELWLEAGGGTDSFDRARYRDLLHNHGHLLSPGDEGYEEARSSGPGCGWQPGTGNGEQ